MESGSSLNSYNSNECPEWYTNRHAVFYKTMYKRLSELKYLNRRSAQYYEKLNFYLVIPSIFITFLSGIASLMTTSEFLSDNTKNVFAVMVGILSSISTLMQSFSGSYKYNTKSELHRNVAENYNKLMVKVRFEMACPNEEDFMDTLEEKILEIQKNCKYFPPQKIINEWNRKELEYKARKNQERPNQIPDNVIVNFNQNPDDNNVPDLNNNEPDLNQDNDQEDIITVVTHDNNTNV